MAATDILSAVHVTADCRGWPRIEHGSVDDAAPAAERFLLPPASPRPLAAPAMHLQAAHRLANAHHHRPESAPLHTACVPKPLAGSDEAVASPPGSGSGSGSGLGSGSLPTSPRLLHNLEHGSSVLALAVSAATGCVYAGTEDGEIVIWALGTFAEIRRVQAHKRSVLCLFLAEDQQQQQQQHSAAGSSGDRTANRPLLISSAGDPLINVWCPRTLTRLYEIYSTHDVGDIFSVAYSRQRDALYLGAQNTTIQWARLGDPRLRAARDSGRHPDRRSHRFFDSRAVFGGDATPRRSDERWGLIPRPGQVLEIDPLSERQFAHCGYVYCMLMARGPTVLVEPDEDVLISGGGDGTVRLWRLGPVPADGEEADFGREGEETIREIMCLGEDDAESVMSLAVDGSFLYAGKLEGVVELWDLDTKQKLRVIKAHDEEATIMAMQMAWGCLWSVAANGYASQHSTVHYGRYHESAAAVSQRYQCLSRWKAHRGKIMAAAAATYGGDNILVTGANDKIVSVWKVPDEPDEMPVGTGAGTGGAGPVEGERHQRAEDDIMFSSLAEFVSYKTISSRPEYAEDCRKGATFLGALFKKLGGQVEMLGGCSDGPQPQQQQQPQPQQQPQQPQKAARSSCNPVVLATFRGKLEPAERRRRILFYGHYDVVPADGKKGNWLSDPFRMRGLNGYLYGRGVSDNKGPIMAALYAVTDLVQARALENDVIFLIEGEEESGSRGFRETVVRNKSLIGPVDYVLLANSYWLDDSVPCLTYGLRGVLHATAEVRSRQPDKHSGVDGSYLLDEPLSDLTRVLATLKGKNNRVMIPTFYDCVLPVSDEEETRYDAITCTLLGLPCRSDPVESAATAGIASATADTTADTTSATVDTTTTTATPQITGSDGNGGGPEMTAAAALKRSLMARWREPNLTLHRYRVSGPDGSLVSAHASAHLSLRLVPGQEADQVMEALRQFLEARFAELGSSNEFEVRMDNKAEPWLGKPGNTIFRTLEGAVMEAWPDCFEQSGDGEGEGENKMTSGSGSGSGSRTGSSRPRKPLYIREGGSIPAIRFLEKEFEAQAAHLPCGQSTDSAHLDNERLRVLNLLKSREIFRMAFTRL